MATQTTERYCPVCGKPVTEATWNRFGEWCCSEEHVAEVRTQKQRQLATTGAVPSQQPRERRSGGCC